MKKTLAVVLISLLFIFAFISCSGDPSNKNNAVDPASTVQKYTREYWGEWKKMDQTETWEINSTSIKVNGVELSRDVTLAKPSENVISVTDNKTTYCLYAVRIASSSILGSVSKEDGSKDISAGWLSVVVENVNDRYDVTNTTTDANGHFSADKLIPGEDYRIRIEDTVLTVRPSFDGEDIGNIKLKSGVNFKVTLSNTNSLMFAGSEHYSMDLIIENIGDTNCTAATYSLVGDDGLEVINNYPEGILLRTVAAGEKKTIPLQVRCDVPYSDTTIKKLNLTITDKDGTVWKDSVSLKFYKGTVTINIVSETGRPISGVIIGDGRTYTLTNDTKYNPTVPITEEGYLLVFSGAIANAEKNTEAIYSIGVNKPAVSASSLLAELGSDVNRFEPNDDENHAQTISVGDTIVSYLFENDIDYYRLWSGHIWDEGVVTKKATCTEDGIVSFVCKDCGQTKEEIIPASHTFSSEWTKDADYHWHAAICGHDAIDGKAAHTWDNGVITKQPTCTETGLKTCRCQICGETKEVTVPAQGHSFSSDWSSDGSYHWHASTCGHDLITGKAEHSWNGGVVTAQPTTYREGVKTYTCTVCGKTKTESIPVITYKVGEIGPAKGYVFYDKGYYSDGWRYLEAAPGDFTEFFEWGRNWGLNTSTEIGAGKNNTDLIVASSSSSDNIAAKACANLSVNGYDDWFLPSKDELNQMYLNLYLNGIGGLGTAESYYWYWSSSAISVNDATGAWAMGFDDGSIWNMSRYYRYRVRAIRAF